MDFNQSEKTTMDQVEGKAFNDLVQKFGDILVIDHSNTEGDTTYDNTLVASDSFEQARNESTDQHNNDFIDQDEKSSDQQNNDSNNQNENTPHDSDDSSSKINDTTNEVLNQEKHLSEAKLSRHSSSDLTDTTLYTDVLTSSSVTNASSSDLESGSLTAHGTTFKLVKNPFFKPNVTLDNDIKQNLIATLDEKASITQPVNTEAPNDSVEMGVSTVSEGKKEKDFLNVRDDLAKEIPQSSNSYKRVCDLLDISCFNEENEKDPKIVPDLQQCIPPPTMFCVENEINPPKDTKIFSDCEDINSKSEIPMYRYISQNPAVANEMQEYFRQPVSAVDLWNEFLDSQPNPEW